MKQEVQLRWIIGSKTHFAICKDDSQQEYNTEWGMKLLGEL